MQHNIQIATSRFNNETWGENNDYRRRINSKGCIYGVPLQISPKIPKRNLVFVVEMNNSKNEIEGIGLVRNQVQFDKYYRIYQTGNYNRYIYKSNYHIARETIETFNEDLLDRIEFILFRGKTHMKRGSGFTLISDKLLKGPICESLDLSKEIRKIFECVFKKKVEEVEYCEEQPPRELLDKEEKQNKNNAII